MARPTKTEQQLRDIKDSYPAPPMVDIAEDVLPTFLAFLQTEVATARQYRDRMLPRWRKWGRTISGERAEAPARPGVSNISVPMTMWARVAVRARLTESAFQGGRRLLNVEPVPGRRDMSGVSNSSIATSINKLVSAEVLNRRGLAGKLAADKVIAELVDLGTGALKVYPEFNRARKVYSAQDGPIVVPDPGKVRWEYISIRDLIYCDGYGTDTQAMPLIGHEFDLRWLEIKQRVTLGYYKKDILAEIEGAMSVDRDRPNQQTPDLREHNVAELYLDYDCDGDGVAESIMLHWHIDAQKILGIWWNPVPQGRRPIVMGQFDLPADPTRALGQGVAEKLEGPQDEVDAIHNIGIEAGKRGASFITVFKEGSRAEEEFGGDEWISPGDKVVTENPPEDIVTMPLGDPRAGISAMQLEEHTRLYVTRILGLDEARIGNVESGKRVAASVGMATLREGRMIIRAALTSLGEMLSEATYLTLDLWKQNLPQEALGSALDQDEAEALINSVFSVQDSSLRSQYIIRFNAQDAAATNEEKKQELLAINQFLFAFYDRMQQMTLMLADPNLPETARKPLLLIVERMERGVEALLQTLDSIPNPEELMVHIGSLKDMLSDATDPSTMRSAQFGTAEAGDEDEQFGDLGAGVT